MNFLKFTGCLIITLSALACEAAQTTGAAHAIALKPATQNAVPVSLITSICTKLATPCNPQTTKAWTGAAPLLGNLFLIDAARPMLIVVRDAQAAHHWDFADYAHTRPPSGADPGEPLEIYPALYPAGDGRYAIALVRRHGEMYSGGGAGFAYADFVLLNTADPADSSKPLLYAGMPFSCSKMVRACFFEREYKTSPHCHDEMSGYLTLQFPARAGGVGWSFTWHQTDWPAHVTKARARHTRTRFTLPSAHSTGDATAVPKNVSFCGGPVS